MMRQIYTKARQLIIWLGEPADEAFNDLAFDVLARLEAYFNRHSQGIQLMTLALFTKYQAPYRIAESSIRKEIDQGLVSDND
jgi:hypothetical protein